MRKKIKRNKIMAILCIVMMVSMIVAVYGQDVFNLGLPYDIPKQPGKYYYNPTEGKLVSEAPKGVSYHDITVSNEKGKPSLNIQVINPKNNIVYQYIETEQQLTIRDYSGTVTSEKTYQSGAYYFKTPLGAVPAPSPPQPPKPQEPTTFDQFKAQNPTLTATQASEVYKIYTANIQLQQATTAAGQPIDPYRVVEVKAGDKTLGYMIGTQNMVFSTQEDASATADKIREIDQLKVAQTQWDAKFASYKNQYPKLTDIQVAELFTGPKPGAPPQNPTQAVQPTAKSVPTLGDKYAVFDREGNLIRAGLGEGEASTIATDINNRQTAIDSFTKQYPTLKLSDSGYFTEKGEQLKATPDGKLYVYNPGLNKLEAFQSGTVTKSEKFGPEGNQQDATVTYKYEKGKTTVEGASISGVKLDAQTYQDVKTLVGADGSLTSQNNVITISDKDGARKATVESAKDSVTTTNYDKASELPNRVITRLPSKEAVIQQDFEIGIFTDDGDFITDKGDINNYIKEQEAAAKEKGESYTPKYGQRNKDASFKSSTERKDTRFTYEDGIPRSETTVIDVKTGELKEFYVAFGKDKDTLIDVGKGGGDKDGIPLPNENVKVAQIDPETGEVIRDLGDALTEEQKEQAEDLYARYERSQFATSLWLGLETAARGGIGKFFSLFMADEDLAEWRRNVDTFFCDTIIAGGIQCWSSRICELWTDIGPSDGFAYLANPAGDLELAAHIEAERSTPITYTADGKPVTEYLYKIEFTLRNPSREGKDEKTLQFNVQLRGEKTVSLFGQGFSISPGDTFTRSQNSAIVQYSNAIYSEACIVFDHSIEVLGDTIKEVCSKIPEASEPELPLGAKPTASGSGASSGQGEPNLADF